MSSHGVGSGYESRFDVWKEWWNDLSEETTCFCPLCEKDHILEIWWNGRGKPRIYCKKCYKTIINDQRIEYEFINHLDHRHCYCPPTYEDGD